MKAEVIQVRASELLKNGKVAVRVEELKKRALKRYDLTVDDIITELEEARELAKQTNQSSTMVSASMGKAKLLGMVTDNISAKITQAPTIVDDI